MAERTYSPIIFLDVPQQELLQRYIVRARNGENAQDFHVKLAFEKMLGIERTKQMANFNITSIEKEAVFSDIDRVLLKYTKNK